MSAPPLSSVRFLFGGEFLLFVSHVVLFDFWEVFLCLAVGSLTVHGQEYWTHKNNFVVERLTHVVCISSV